MPLFLLTFFTNAKQYIIGALILVFIVAVGVHEYNIHNLQSTMMKQAAQNVSLQVQTQEAVKVVEQQKIDITAQQVATKNIISQFNKSDVIVQTEQKKVDAAIGVITNKNTQSVENFANQETAAIFQCIEDISNDKVCANE